MASVFLAFERCIQDSFSACLELTNRVKTSWLIVSFGEEEQSWVGSRDHA